MWRNILILASILLRQICWMNFVNHKEMHPNISCHYVIVLFNELSFVDFATGWKQSQTLLHPSIHFFFKLAKSLNDSSLYNLISFIENIQFSLCVFCLYDLFISLHREVFLKCFYIFYKRLTRPMYFFLPSWSLGCRFRWRLCQQNIWVLVLILHPVVNSSISPNLWRRWQTSRRTAWVWRQWVWDWAWPWETPTTGNVHPAPSASLSGDTHCKGILIIP